MKNSTNDKIFFYDLEKMPYVSAVKAENITNRFPRHSHSSYTFAVIDHGERKIKYQLDTITYCAGEMCILSPGTSHICESQKDRQFGPHSYRAICIAPKYMNKITNEITATSETLPDFNPKKIYKNFDINSFDEFFNLIRTPDTFFEKQTALNSFLYHTILNLSTGEYIPANTGPQTESLERVKDFINKNFSNKFTLQDLAETGCISPFHLQKLFVKKYGMSPQEYTTLLRIKKAKTLLSDHYTIIETALKSGFSDQSHFSRHFKRVIGITPGRFIKNNSYSPPSCSDR